MAAVLTIDGEIINCTIVFNTSNTAEGGGIKNCDGTITNCIVWANNPNQLYNCVNPDYSCIQDWAEGGTGNISEDPQLVFANDCRLSAGSPCIDAGRGAGLYEDIDGNIRPFDFPGVDNNGQLPDFDMGAYEAVASTEGELTILPPVVNQHGPAQKILAMMLLPEPIVKNDIDEQALLVLYPGPIEATEQHIIQPVRGRQRSVRIIAVFDRAELLGAWGDNGNIEVAGIGRFISGEYFYGLDTVRIIDRNRGRLSRDSGSATVAGVYRKR